MLGPLSQKEVLTLNPPRGIYYGIYAKGGHFDPSQKCYFYENLLVLNDIKVPNIFPQIVLHHKLIIRKFKLIYMDSYNMKCKGWYFLI